MKNPFEELAEHYKIIEEKLNLILERLPDPKAGQGLSRQGGIELAEEVTGYKPSYIKLLVSKGKLPTVSAPFAKLRFDEVQLRDFMQNQGRKTKDPSKGSGRSK